MIWRIDAAAAADGERCALAPASLLISIHSEPSRDRKGAAPPKLHHAPILTFAPKAIPQSLHPNQVPLPHGRGSDGPSTPFSCTLLALAHPSEIDRHTAAAEVPPERHLRFPTSAITPALVNAHAHLDLTHIGPRPYDTSGGGGFVGWAMSLVRPNRAATLEAALASLREGIRRSHAGGVVAVGDIIGAIPNHNQGEDPRVTLARELRNHFGQNVAAYAEVFGYGPSQPRALADLESLAAAGCDLQPHAPYSVAPSVYTRAAELARASQSPPRLCTHLAETLDERRFIQKGEGPFKELLERIGLWNNESARDVGQGQHPIEHVLAAISPNRTRSVSDGLGDGLADPVPLLAAHVNDCPQHLIPLLKKNNFSVAYCPRAHTYFQHPTTTGPHKYREMLEAGVNVCLATDSIINLPESQSNRISPLDDARLLFHRDHTDARTLLATITTHGARALNLNPAHFSFTNPSTHGSGGVQSPTPPGTPPGTLAGLLAIDITGTPDSDPPANRIMQSHATPTLLRWSQQTPA